jgi:hypothetical protein
MSAGSDDYMYSLMCSAMYTTLTNPSILKQLGFAAYQEFVPKLVQTVHNNLQDTGKVDEQMMKHQQEQLTPRGSGHKSKRKQTNVATTKAMTPETLYDPWVDGIANVVGRKETTSSQLDEYGKALMPGFRILPRCLRAGRRAPARRHPSFSYRQRHDRAARRPLARHLPRSRSA